MNLAFILAVGLIAGTISGVIGFGSSIMPEAASSLAVYVAKVMVFRTFGALP